ncbi:17141_t:CDS:2, partial [Dentiscutata heterogama]
MSLSLYPGTNCTPEEWYEYCKMPQVRENETPSEEHGLLLTQSKKYLEAKELILFPNNTPYAREIRLAICFSCNQLIYCGQRTQNIGNYNHIGIERHWKFSCIGNKYCGVSHDEYLKIKQKPKYNFDDKDVGRKIQACIIIQRKVVEWIYRPDGLTAQELALHYTCLQSRNA